MSHLSTLVIHQYQLDELLPAARAQAEAHLAACAPCAQRLEVALADAAAIESEPLPDFLLGEPALGGQADLDDQPTAAMPQPAASPAQWLVWLRRMAPPSVALAAAAALLIMALPAVQRPADDGIQTRGELPTVEVWLQADAGPRPLRVGEALGDGDQVQLFFDPKDAAVVGLAGRDHSGAIEVYKLLHPTRDGLQAAPFGLTLDEAPGVQEFFVVAGGADLDEAAVKAAIEDRSPAVRRIVVPKDPYP